MKLTPLYDRVIIKRKSSEVTTSFGIIIPESKDKPDEGTVIAVGPGKSYDSGNEPGIDMKVGDHVYFTKYAGMEVKLDGETFLVLKEEDIYAVESAE